MWSEFFDAGCWTLDARRFEFIRTTALNKKLFAVDFFFLPAAAG